MTVTKNIHIELDIDIKFKDVYDLVEEEIGSVDILWNDEYRRKAVAFKNDLYKKWVEIYWALQQAEIAIEGKDPVPPSIREQLKDYFEYSPSIFEPVTNNQSTNQPNMQTLPPNAALILPTLKEAIREQERLHAVWLQDQVTELNTKMVSEIEAIIKAHRDMAEYITQPGAALSVTSSVAEMPHLNQGDEDYEIDN